MITIKSYPKTEIDELKRKVCELRKENHELHDIASITGFSYSQVRNILSKHGIKRSIPNSGPNNKLWKGFAELSAEYFNRIKDRAIKIRKIYFDLKIEDCWNLFVKQNKKCVISGKDLILHTPCKKGQRAKRTASLDRIDNNRGYTLDNIQWVHKDVNMARGADTIKDFIAKCKEVYLWQKNKKYIDELDCSILKYVWKEAKKQNCLKFNSLFTGYKTFSGKYVNSIEKRAKNKNIEFNLTCKFLYNMYKSQRYRCSLSGRLLIPHKIGVFDKTVSVDRIDSDMGYTEDNVQFIHKDFQYAKGSHKTEHFLKLCEIINNYNKVETV